MTRGPWEADPAFSFTILAGRQRVRGKRKRPMNRPLTPEPQGICPRQNGAREMSMRGQILHRTMVLSGALAALWLGISVPAAPVFDTTTPASFFTNVADRVLRAETAGWQARDFFGYTNTFGATVTNAFGVTNLPVYINGSLVYTPFVQRLLQVTANIFEATSTNPYPAVYRPVFYRDPASGNVFINGYQLVPSVTGIDDPVLAAPVDIAAVASGAVPVSTNLNIYGVPWIIGARKGFPGFYEFNVLNAVQVTRRLQFGRGSTNTINPANYITNQMYIMSISNSVGVSLWNSYDSNYVGTGNIQIFVQDTMRVALSNSFNYGISTYVNQYSANVGYWPGSGWTYAPAATPAPVSGSFYFTNFSIPFLPPSAYQWQSGSFINISNNPAWETSVTDNQPFPQFQYMTTNWLQAFVLDGPHIIDYVQFSGPNRTRNLTTELADYNYMGQPGPAYMWSTNGYPLRNPSSALTYGEINQILVSEGQLPAPPGGVWSVAPVGPGFTTLSAEQAFFAGFWKPNFAYNGKTYANTNLRVEAPFVPTRTMYDYTLWQANDPLVHYLASDLNYVSPGTTGLLKTDGRIPNLSGYNLNQLGNRDQPWGIAGQMAQVYGVDPSAYNLALKDPLVLGSDYWSFPTNQTWNANWLGQIHRGTPWQTIYLKSSNVLAETTNNGVNIGTNTWEVWTGLIDPIQAAYTSPVNDWHLASLLCALLDTNAATAFFSVNNPDPSAWTVPFDGLTAWTNDLPPGTPILLSSNSPALSGLVSAILSTRTGDPGQQFSDVGDLEATPALSVQSPFLNWSDPFQQRRGITDANYEALPSQLLSQLGLASLGNLVFTNGQWLAQFTGAAGNVYCVQSSPDLLIWTTLSTNQPVNGQISFVIPPPTGAPQFYRTRLLP